MYVRRIVDDDLDELLSALPAIAVEGAKAVGKTAMATQRAATVRLLDDENDREIVAAAPEHAVALPPPVLFDEWQLVPSIWDRVRRAVDSGARPGSFLLTGSASPRAAGSHSGGGRIVSVRLRPLSLAERIDDAPTVSLAGLLRGGRLAVAGKTRVGLEDYTDEVIRSGFPGIRRLSGRALTAQLDGYLARIVDRDFAELGHVVRNPSALRRWMTAYAAATATTTSMEKIRRGAEGGEPAPARSTVLPYRDVLERLFILEPVPAWRPSRNQLGALAQPAKHHLADPALAAALLGVDASTLLSGADVGPAIPRDGTLLGALFESLVTQSIRVYAQAAEAEVGHLRTRRGDREIDLVVHRRDGRAVAIEAKLRRTPSDHSVRHLRWLADRLGDDLLDAVVITTGDEAYRRPDGIAVVPAALLGP